MYAIALDLGTSGFRAQLIDLNTKENIKTVLTMRHPLPGGNVIDHLDFAIQAGQEVANSIILETVEKIIRKFNVELSQIEKIAVCGNPIQLSLFQNIEIRDLAYAGENKQKKLGVEKVKRDGGIFSAKDIFKTLNLPDCEVIIPPAIKHEIGADALAMMLKTDFINQKKASIVTDYGTNAEMALNVGDRIITGSAAAGPAIEGQGINCGMLASPGAISDVNVEDEFWRLTVLDEKMEERQGSLIDPISGEIQEKSGFKVKGVTGTGVISALSLALETGIITKLPKLPDGKLFLDQNVVLTEMDIEEAGKAIGAIRASHLSLLTESGISYDELENIYMSGASGTYVDANKGKKIGLFPGFAKNVVQFGNTSLSLARDLVMDESVIWDVCDVARKIEADHLMMATSKTFSNIYMCELSYWTQGMSMEMYNQMLGIYKVPEIPSYAVDQTIEKRVDKDIDDVGVLGVDTIYEIGSMVEETAQNCIFCRQCETECPESAIKIVPSGNQFVARFSTERCLGTSCRRCINVCPAKAINGTDFVIIN